MFPIFKIYKPYSFSLSPYYGSGVMSGTVRNKSSFQVYTQYIYYTLSAHGAMVLSSYVIIFYLLVSTSLRSNIQVSPMSNVFALANIIYDTIYNIFTSQIPS